MTDMVPQCLGHTLPQAGREGSPRGQPAVHHSMQQAAQRRLLQEEVQMVGMVPLRLGHTLPQAGRAGSLPLRPAQLADSLPLLGTEMGQAGQPRSLLPAEVQKHSPPLQLPVAAACLAQREAPARRPRCDPPGVSVAACVSGGGNIPLAAPAAPPAAWPPSSPQCHAAIGGRAGAEGLDGCQGKVKQTVGD